MKYSMMNKIVKDFNSKHVFVKLNPIPVTLSKYDLGYWIAPGVYELGSMRKMEKELAEAKEIIMTTPIADVADKAIFLYDYTKL